VKVSCYLIIENYDARKAAVVTYRGRPRKQLADTLDTLADALVTLPN
jgi:hypothetical protein